MPNYTWICFACGRSNGAGTATCQHCGFSATATGQEIEVVRSKKVAVQEAEPRAADHVAGEFAKPKENMPPEVTALFLFIFGVVCLIGAYQSFTGGRWPVFMPLQLDVFAVPLSWISERLGAYVGGILATAFGLVCVVASITSLLPEDDA